MPTVLESILTRIETTLTSTFSAGYTVLRAPVNLISESEVPAILLNISTLEILQDLDELHRQWELTLTIDTILSNRLSTQQEQIALAADIHSSVLSDRDFSSIGGGFLYYQGWSFNDDDSGDTTYSMAAHTFSVEFFTYSLNLET